MHSRGWGSVGWRSQGVKADDSVDPGEVPSSSAANLALRFGVPAPIRGAAAGAQTAANVRKGKLVKRNEMKGDSIVIQRVHEM
jgi:hypothetical protein